MLQLEQMRYILTAALLATAPAEAAMRHAVGTFEVKMTQREADVADGVPLARIHVAKTFTGGLAATGSGDMLTGGDPAAGSSAYVLIERVTGTLDGTPGSFALMHSATMYGGKQDQRIVVVPGTGTGALTGLTGTLTMRIEGGKHFYDLAYEIAPR